MTEFIASDTTNSRAKIKEKPYTVVRFWHVAPVLVGIAVATFFVLPVVMWAYHIDQAGRAMAIALQWPAPRLADSLPTLTDTPAADRGLRQLAAAERWRPHDAYAHRLAAQISAAQNNWAMAADELTQARALRPKDPQLAWEQALVFEQMAHLVTTAPRENILPDLASVPIDAPNTPIDTVYCRNNKAETCYVDLDSYTQPYAVMPDGPQITADVLFMHPPAAVKLERYVAPERSALRFLMGLDPGVRSWQTDGASFQIWITAGTQPAVNVFERFIDPATAKQGWVPAWVDLTAWSGQRITLELRTTGGPSANTTDDWYGWGDVSQTSRTAAELSTFMPAARLREIWAAGLINPAEFTTLGDEARASGLTDLALRWYSRALLNDPTSRVAQLHIGTLCQTIPAAVDACAHYLEDHQHNRFVDSEFTAASLHDAWAMFADDQASAYTETPCPNITATRCAMVTVSSATSPYGAGVYQCMRVEPGQRYHYAVWLRVETQPAGQWRPLYLEGKINGQDSGVWAGNGFYQGSRDWTFFETTWTAPAFDNNIACFHPIRLQSQGHAWMHTPELRLVDHQ